MKPPSTQCGEALNPHDKENVEQLRLRLGNLIPSRYDTDFNLYRWLLNAERSHKGRDFLGLAEQHLRNHIRYRKALKLDTEPVPNWDENPIHQQRLLPKGTLVGTDKSNRVLWFNEYRTIDMEGLMNTLRSSEMLIYHFWLYDEMLRIVNEQEAMTGLLSGIHCLIDLDDYAMNPFSMLFVTSGSMGYYTHLFHYEHYPELVSPTDFVNAAKWMSVPYRVVKGIMPQGFTDRFRVHDSNFLDTLLKEFHLEEIPETLGGQAPNMGSVPARKITKTEHWQPTTADPNPQDLHHLVVAPRRRKVIPIEIFRPNTKLSWYFTTDAELYFGIFFTPLQGLNQISDSINGFSSSKKKHRSSGDINHLGIKMVQPNPKKNSSIENGEIGDHEQELPMYPNGMHKKDIQRMEMVEPWFRLAGRLVPEEGCLFCEKPGNYYVVFCNKNAWLTKRNIRIRLEIETAADRPLLERTFSL